MFYWQFHIMFVRAYLDISDRWFGNTGFRITSHMQVCEAEIVMCRSNSY